MNKQDLISTVAESSGLSKNDATKAVEGVFDAITGALKKGDEVRLVGFGTAEVHGRQGPEGFGQLRARASVRADARSG